MKKKPSRDQGLVEYAAGLKDSSLLDYAQLKEKIINSGKLAKFKKDIKENYDPNKRNIVVLGTGGTFQSAKTDKGIAPSGSLEETFKEMNLSYNQNEIKLNLFEIFNYDSSLLQVGDHVRFIAEVLVELLQDCAQYTDGIIITHGTDTMAETANYLSLMLGRGLKKPIILTGSQEAARTRHSDAVNNMSNCLKVMERLNEHNIAEVMVLCGSELVRGAWVQKQSDKDSHAFASYNDKPIIDVTNQLVKQWRIPEWALRADDRIPFTPFCEVQHSADVLQVKLADISPKKLAEIIVDTRLSALTLLGSATCPNIHADLIVKAVQNGKIIALLSPFPDAELVPGTYAAGSALGQANIPLLKGTASFIAAKMNILCAELEIEFTKKAGYGDVVSPEALRKFYKHLAGNTIGEWDQN